MKFFDDMTVEEFEEMFIENGINEILPSVQSNYVKAIKE